eukprot:15235783-Alexandrium_andersonii.AAC.1
MCPKSTKWAAEAAAETANPTRCDRPAGSTDDWSAGWLRGIRLSRVRGHPVDRTVDYPRSSSLTSVI